MRRYFRVTPYPDEEIGSLLTRTIRKIGISASDFTYWHLGLVRTSVIAVGNLIPSIAALTDSTPRRVLQEHTLVPYGTAGLSPQESRRVTVALTSGRALLQSPKLGRIGRRWCEICLQHDLEQYGESYWHRAHLLPGVFICHEHGIPLLELPGSAAMLSTHRAVTYWLRGSLPHELIGNPLHISLPAELRHAICRASVRLVRGRRLTQSLLISPTIWRQVFSPHFLKFAGCRGSSLCTMPQTTARILSWVAGRHTEQQRSGIQLDLLPEI